MSGMRSRQGAGPRRPARNPEEEEKILIRREGRTMLSRTILPIGLMTFGVSAVVFAAQGIDIVETCIRSAMLLAAVITGVSLVLLLGMTIGGKTSARRPATAQPALVRQTSHPDAPPAAKEREVA